MIGSQAVLVGAGMYTGIIASMEIDAFPANAPQWEAARPGELASEEINALFGEGSAFAVAHGFYIDGVDETTAVLPPDWRDRAERLSIDVDGRAVTVVAPSLVDLVVSKLWRLDDKDKRFIRAALSRRSAFPTIAASRLAEALTRTDPPLELLARMNDFIDELVADGLLDATPRSEA